MRSDRDVLAQWAGEELIAATRNSKAAAQHRARNAFYLELLRHEPFPPPLPSIGQQLAAQR